MDWIGQWDKCILGWMFMDSPRTSIGQLDCYQMCWWIVLGHPYDSGFAMIMLWARWCVGWMSVCIVLYM